MRRRQPTIASQDALVAHGEALEKQIAAMEKTLTAREERIDDLVKANESLAGKFTNADAKATALAEARVEALDMLRHMQAEALYWRGVACGMDPEKAAAAETARRGQRFGDLAERMEAGDGGRKEALARTFVAGGFADPNKGRRL
jgi:outer membrane cobalamin receptor